MRLVIFFCLIVLAICGTPEVSLPFAVSVVGPFPVGTREIGGDPLEAFGGISQALQNTSQVFPSELVDGGYAGFREVLFYEKTSINVNYSDVVRWDFMAQPFGSTIGYRFRSWVAFKINVLKSGTFLATCAPCSVWYIGNQTLQGDIYGLGYGQFPITLDSGEYPVYIPVVANGPTFTININFDNVAEGDWQLLPNEEVLLPTIVDGTLVGNYIAVTILNTKNAVIENITVSEATGLPVSVHFSPRIAPGQAVQVAVYVNQSTGISTGPMTLQFAAPNIALPLKVPIAFPTSTVDSFKFTFIDTDNSVQYAMARSPVKGCTNMPDAKCPVILALHGAGSRPEWMIGDFQPQDNAWILAPNGKRRFGYDWMTPQLNNAFKALNALAAVSEGSVTKYPVHAYRIMYAGHSMGGHGCYHISTHYPDLALGAVCAAGWTRYEEYVPYYTRQGNSFVDPTMYGVLASAISEDSADLHVENLRGIPFMTRFGGNDEDVSPWFPRKMARIYDEMNGKPKSAVVSEVPGQPHWFNGIFGGQEVQNFLNAALSPTSPVYPDLPNVFTLVLTHPFTFGSKGGIKPIQLVQPYKLSKIQVTRSSDNLKWTLRTMNIRRFGFVDFASKNITKSWYPKGTEASPFVLKVDQQEFTFTKKGIPSYEDTHFCMDNTNTWSMCSGPLNDMGERIPSTYGPAKQVFDHTPFAIVYGTKKQEMIATYKDAAAYLANSMYYRGRHSPPILADTEFENSVYDKNGYNVILLGGAESNTISQAYPNSITQYSNNYESFSFNGYTLNTNQGNYGMLFLQPFLTSNEIPERLALVISGSNVRGFKVAVKAFPGTSGLLIPDYVVVSDELLWKGDGGILAAGYYGNQWSFKSDLSFVDTIGVQAPYVSPWNAEAVLGMVYFVTIAIIIVIVATVFTIYSYKNDLKRRQQLEEQENYAPVQ